MTRRVATLGLVAGALACAPAAPAWAASVDVLVVGKGEQALAPAREVRLTEQRVKVGSRRCTVGAATPLAALVRTHLKLRVKDYGSCGRAARDAGGLFVRQVGPDRNAGRNGWVYKVGRKAGTNGAGDLAGPFGAGRLRDGQRVLWFYCTFDAAASSCQRSLEARPASSAVAPGAPLEVTVRGYDDRGRGVPVAGATVALGSSTATTDAAGVATLIAPTGEGELLDLSAQHDGLVPAFPREITVR